MEKAIIVIFAILTIIDILATVEAIISYIWYYTGRPKCMDKIYHDFFQMHRPDADSPGIEYNGNEWCYVCKYCGKAIWQDSQGRWFLGG